MKKFLLLSNEDNSLIAEYLPNDNEINTISNFYSCFSDPTRIKLILLLSIKELCVNDICNVLNMNQTTISHQLKYLKDKKILNCYRDGKLIKYYIKSSVINEILSSGVNFVINENII